MRAITKHTKTEKTNLSLCNAKEGEQLARERYNMSLSEMVDYLIAKEHARKNGVLGKKLRRAA